MRARRLEHERRRKQLKDQWQRELRRMQEADGAKRKAYALFAQRQQAAKAAVDPDTKPERRRKVDDDAIQKVCTKSWRESLFIILLVSFAGFWGGEHLQKGVHGRGDANAAAAEGQVRGFAQFAGATTAVRPDHQGCLHELLPTAA